MGVRRSIRASTLSGCSSWMGGNPSAMAPSGSRATGYSSYSTLISFKARWAVIRSSATTAAMSSP